jgi:hypothetical protein
LTHETPPRRPRRDSYKIREAEQVHVHNYVRPKKRKKVKQPYQFEVDTPEIGCAVPLAGAVFFLFVIGLLVYSCGSWGDKLDFPDEGDKPPAGAPPSGAVDNAAEAIRSCVQEVVLRPATCPQRAKDSPDQATAVRWTLHGDLRDGAQWRYVQDSGTFVVVGSAPMSVSYVVGNEHRFELQNVVYLAEVKHTVRGFVTASINRYAKSLHKPILKTNPNIPIEAARSLVRTAFEACARGKHSPMAPTCPVPSRSIQWDKAKWTLHGDPTANSVITFDSHTGLVHMLGSYSMTVNLVGRFSDQRQQNGNYDAILSLDGGQARVIQIAAAGE